MRTCTTLSFFTRIFAFCVLGFCLATPLLAQNTPSISSTAQSVISLAEELYPSLFGNNGTKLQVALGYTYKFYPLSGIYAGFKDGKVFLMGGPFGNGITEQGAETSVLALLQAEKVRQSKSNSDLYSKTGNTHNILKTWGVGTYHPTGSTMSLYEHNADGSTGSLVFGHANDLLGIYDCGTTIEADGSVLIGLNKYSYEKRGEDYSINSSRIRMFADSSSFDLGIISVVEVFKDSRGYRSYTEGTAIEYWCSSSFYDEFRFPSTAAVYPKSLSGNYEGPMERGFFSKTPPDYIQTGNYCELSTKDFGVEVSIASYSTGSRRLLKTFTFQTYDLNEAPKNGEYYTLLDKNPLKDAENASALTFHNPTNDSVYISISTGQGTYVDKVEPYLDTAWSFICSLKKK